MGERKWAMLATSVRGANILAFAAGVMLLVAACGSSPQMPTAGPTTLGTPTSSATGSPPTAGANGPTSTTASTPTSAPAIPPASISAPTALVPRSRAGQVVNRIPTNRKVVALTFDAGANGDGANAILATLTSQKVAASFFLTGHFTASFPTLAREMAATGRLGNHTADHPICHDGRWAGTQAGHQRTGRDRARHRPGPAPALPLPVRRLHAGRPATGQRPRLRCHGLDRRHPRLAGDLGWSQRELGGRTGPDRSGPGRDRAHACRVQPGRPQHSGRRLPPARHLRTAVSEHWDGGFILRSLPCGVRFGISLRGETCSCW
jgi:Polysaccharide deacetylase